MRHPIKIIRNLLGFRKPVFLRHGEESRLLDLLKNLKLFCRMNTFTEDSISHANPHYTYYLLTKIPRIESLTDPTVLVNQGILDQYNKSDHVHLIYDLSTESITFTDYGSKILKQFHEILIKQRIENKRVFLLCANANAAQHYEAWANANNFSHFKINMIGYHFYLYEYYNETQKCDWLKSNRFALKNSSSKTVTDGLKRNKHFLCLNLRPRMSSHCHFTAFA